ncbi:MAG: DinB family protein [bacterium]|nr:DinB family protein [bacterium]
MTRLPRPVPGDHAPYYGKYIEPVLDSDILSTLMAQITEAQSLLQSLDEKSALHRYAPGKWSIKELLGHLIDTERLFLYRATSIARADPTELPGMDENAWVAGADFDRIPLADLLDEFVNLRRSTVRFFAALSPEALARAGTANNNRIVVRAIPYITAGHAAHHLEVLRTRYLTG